MKIGMNQAVMFSASTDEFLELCSHYEIGNVELRVPKLKEWLYANTASNARSRLKALNIEVAAVNSLDDFGMVPKENLPILRSEADFVGKLCEAVECPLVIAPVGRWGGTPNLYTDEVMRITLERLELLTAILRPYGVKVGVEPIAFPEFTIKTIQETDELCASSGNSDNGLVVDYYNLFQGGMQPKDFHTLISPVHIIHINDAELYPADSLDVVSTRTFPGDGSIDVVEWTAEAVRSGYRGVFSLEIFPKDLWDLDPRVAMHKTVQKLKQFTREVGVALEERRGVRDEGSCV